jgi:hypothetical protein
LASAEPNAAPRVGEPQVHEAGAGDVDAQQVVAEVLREGDGQALGDHRRRGAHDLRQQHRRVRRVVAVLGLLRALERRRGLRSLSPGHGEHGVVEDGA